MLTDREQKLVNWLRTRKVATMRHLQHQFQVCHMTVFRALKKVGYHTSYNRNAGYYTFADRRILEIYLNVAEFGTGIYGAEAAARRYFGKAAGDLDEDEAARLAVCLPNPVAWNPEQKSRVAERRVAIIRRRMKRAQWLERLI